MSRNKTYTDNWSYWRERMEFFRTKKRQRRRLLWRAAMKCEKISYLLYFIRRKERMKNG